MKNGCFVPKAKNNRKNHRVPYHTTLYHNRLRQKMQQEFLSFILASHLVFTDIVSPVDEPRLASPGFVVSCIFFSSQSIPREEAAGRPAPSTPLHLNGKAENQGENQEPNRYDVKHHQAILDL